MPTQIGENRAKKMLKANEVLHGLVRFTLTPKFDLVETLK